MNILMIGGGICGLGTALLLARDGHDVTVLERDTNPVPDSPQSAWDSWGRSGVAQFKQPHNLMPGLRLLLEAELPDIQQALPRAGAVKYEFVNPLPPHFTDRTPRPIDEKLWTYTARRPVAEWVFADAAQREPGVRLRRGVRVAELLTGQAVIEGTPHVTGVRTADGESLHADLVIDATGRQSKAAEWLQAIGARAPHQEQADSGFAYYTRYFEGTQPQRRGATLTFIGTMSLLTLPGDNGTWSVTLFAAAGDQPLKAFRDEKKWTAVVRACPNHAHWLDGEPLTGVIPMAGIVDRYRRFVVDDQPVVTGFVAVADAWACTNPSAGRGLTVGLLHAAQLRDAVREAANDPAALVRRFDERTETHITPWYRAQIAVDRARYAEMDALRAGGVPEAPADGLAQGILGLLSVMPASPDLFRTGIEYVSTITPIQEILKRPGLGEAIGAAREAMKAAPPPPPMGPNREQLLELLK